MAYNEEYSQEDENVEEGMQPLSKSISSQFQQGGEEKRAPVQSGGSGMFTNIQDYIKSPETAKQMAGKVGQRLTGRAQDIQQKAEGKVVKFEDQYNPEYKKVYQASKDYPKKILSASEKAQEYYDKTATPGLTSYQTKLGGAGDFISSALSQAGTESPEVLKQRAADFQKLREGTYGLGEGQTNVLGETDMAQNYLKQGGNLVKEELDPYMSEIQQLQEGTYAKAPEAINLAEQQLAQQNLQKQAQNILSEQGTRQALQETFNRPDYTRGMRDLDYLMMRQDPAQEVLAQKGKEASNILNQYAQSGDVSMLSPEQRKQLEDVQGLQRRQELSRLQSQALQNLAGKYATGGEFDLGKQLAAARLGGVDTRLGDLEALEQQIDPLAQQYQIGGEQDVYAKLLGDQGLIPTTMSDIEAARSAENINRENLRAELAKSLEQQQARELPTDPIALAEYYKGLDPLAGTQLVDYGVNIGDYLAPESATSLSQQQYMSPEQISRINALRTLAGQTDVPQLQKEEAQGVFDEAGFKQAVEAERRRILDASYAQLVANLNKAPSGGTTGSGGMSGLNLPSFEGLGNLQLGGGNFQM